MIVVILISFDNLFKVLQEKIMLKKYSTLMLIGLIINLAFSSFVFAQNAETKATEKNEVKDCQARNWRQSS